jgi:hypothetical protein
MNPRRLAAAGLLGLAAIVWVAGRPADKPAPTPAPPPHDGLVLRGLFVGPEAAADAASLSALCYSLGDIVSWDAMQPQPRLLTGVAFDDLRIAAREARLHGDSIGARQPRVRDAVKAYLDAKIGTSGGPVTPESRSAWAGAFNAIGRAAEDAQR